MIDAHALSSTVDLSRLLKNGDSRNIQISDLVKALAASEPCLFNNSEENLMPVVHKVLVGPVGIEPTAKAL